MGLRILMIVAVAALILSLSPITTAQTGMTGGTHAPKAEVAMRQPTAFKFGGVREGVFSNKPAGMLSVTDLQTGIQRTIVVPSRDATGKKLDIDPKLLETFRSLASGQVVLLTTVVSEGRQVLDTLSVYKPKPGEDEPNVFVFKKMTTRKVGTQDREGFIVEKQLQQGVILFPPPKQDAGGMGSALLTESVRKLHDGDVVEIQTERVGDAAVLKSIKPYTPPSAAIFAKLIEKKPGEGSFAAIEVKTAGGAIETLKIPNYLNSLGALAPERNLLTAAMALRPEQKIEYRTSKDDKGTWLSLLRPASEKN